MELHALNKNNLLNCLNKYGMHILTFINNNYYFTSSLFAWVLLCYCGLLQRLLLDNAFTVPYYWHTHLKYVLRLLWRGLLLRLAWCLFWLIYHILADTNMPLCCLFTERAVAVWALDRVKFLLDRGWGWPKLANISPIFLNLSYLFIIFHILNEVLVSLLPITFFLFVLDCLHLFFLIIIIYLFSCGLNGGRTFANLFMLGYTISVEIPSAFTTRHQFTFLFISILFERLLLLRLSNLIISHDCLLMQGL